MTSIFKKLLMTAAVIGLSTSMALAALTLEAAKTQGLVGEKTDGLLGVVTSSPEVSTLTSSINAERLEKYKSIAEKNGTALTQVQALAGKKLIESAAKGEYIMTASGSWQKK